jgi:exosortase A
MSITMNDALRGDQRVQYWAACGVLLLAVALAYRESWATLINTWRSDTTFSHGLLIVPMTLYLIWLKRGELERIELRPSWTGLGLLCAALALWALGRLVHVRVLEQLGLVGMLQSVVPLVLGLGATRILMFPLAFLWFAVPFGKELVPPLMEITADLSVLLLRLTGVPVYRDGMLLHIPAGTYEVARACSGIKFLITTTALGAFYAYVIYTSQRKRVVFVAAAILTAILSNGIRAYLLVLIGHLTDMTFEHDRWHILFGYVVFGVILLTLFYVGSRYRDESPRVQEPEAGGRSGAARTPWPLTASACALLIGVPVGAHAFVQSGGSPASIAAMAVVPTASKGWQRLDKESPAWRPHISGGSNRVEARYRKDAAIVDLFVEVFPLPSADGAEMIAYRNSIQSDANERLYPDRVRDPQLAARPGFRVRETRVSHERMAWYWYDVAGQNLVSPSRVKLAEALALARHLRSAQRVIVISTTAPPDALADFLAAHDAQLVAPGALP